ncbi:MAG TPA: hypothetical protein PLV83_00700 [Bacilli bacterium]|nr:hypothetical protein [Bacilli bacterium]
MAYNNDGCNTCNQAIPPACVEAPPVCAGSQCEEIYPGACVVYSGPNIPCLGITNGMSLNDIIQAIGEQLCSENCCTNPVYWFLNYAKNIYDIHTEKGLNPDILEILDSLLENGIVMSSCNICCPDWQWYMISDNETVEAIRVKISTNGPVTNNSITNFDSCMALLEARELTIPNRFINDPSLDLAGVEWGTIQGQTTLCLFNEIFDSNTFSGQTLYDILDKVITLGLTVKCENGIFKILNISNFLTDNNIILS